MRKIILTIILAMVILSGCNKQENTLESVEVKDYRGEKLDSIYDFRENSIKGPQYVNISDYELEISGEVREPLRLRYDEVLELESFKKIVTLHCVEGWDAKILWEGVLIEDLIDKAKAKEGANTIIFHAVDGYTSSLPLDHIKENDILLAYKMNNLTLIPQRGFPFIVVAQDKWGYKWVKWVDKIEVSDNEEYKGFWEQRGYNNDASLDLPKFS